VSKELPIVLKLDNQEIKATTVNVSSGGVAVRSTAKLSHEGLFEVSFNLQEGASPISAKAKLAWTGPDGLAGLNFVEIHPAFQRELHQWLAEKAQAEGWMEAAAGR
jgi:c-di-GMP-binding flagellar brake protein YcgR